MEKHSPVKVVVFFCLNVFFLGCLIGSNQPSTEETAENALCQSPPSDFSSSDLIGTWMAGRADWSDTLTIRSDGTYVQTLHLVSGTDQYDYESIPLSWELDNNTSVLPYLHLTGYRVCAYWPEISCDQVGGGDGYWIDFCYQDSTDIPNGSTYEGRGIQMFGEGIFIVMGAPENSIVISLLARGIYATWTFYRIVP